MSGGNSGGRLLGKLLLPGYTDAGASSSFRPQAADDDLASEAATEIRDNRTSTLLVDDTARRGAETPSRHFLNPRGRANSHGGGTMASSNTTTLAGLRKYSADLGNDSSLEAPSTPSSSKYGFFPSTKPLHTMAALAAPSPKPHSPPQVSRQQMPCRAVSVAGTSVVPEIGMSSYEEERLDQEQADTRNKERLDRLLGQEKAEGSDGTTGVRILRLNAANLEQKQSELEQQQRRHQTDKETDSRTTDESSKGGNRDSSLLEEDDASEIVSEALSTASEMGTVINVGSARMDEIDAMAALIEASPNVDYRHEPSMPQIFTDLALPVLDSERPDTLPTSKTVQPEFDSGENKTKDVGEKQTQTQTSTSAMVTAAIRRIGSGISKRTLSAPPTPKTPGVPQAPRVEDLLKTTLTPRIDSLNKNKDPTPSSFALRSPGSSARFSLKTTVRQQVLTPRFSSVSSSSEFQEPPNSTPKPQGSTTPRSQASSSHMRPTPMSPRSLLPVGPFRLAQKCFSYDSTMDGGASYEPVHQLPAQRTAYQSLEPRTKTSQSWDMGSAAAAPPKPLHFRSQAHRWGGIQQTLSEDEFQEQRRERTNSDFSPTKHSHMTQALEPHTPRQQLDLEREDALDILSCLVERGTAAWKPEGKVEADDQSLTDATSDVSFTGATEALISKMMDEMKAISSEGAADHEQRMAALDELLKSHAYALEMKRAALSASAWLKSIGRGADDMHPTQAKGPLPQMPIPEDDERQTSGELDRNETSALSANTSKMELLTLTARLHSAESELEQKSHAFLQLNQELSKCRAEIGRLKLVSRAELSVTQNRSILDDSTDASTTSTGVVNSADRSSGTTTPIPKANNEDGEDNEKLFEESFDGNNSLFQSPSEDAHKADVATLQAALERANATIRTLHGQLNGMKSDCEDDEKKDDPAPVVDAPEVSLNRSTTDRTAKSASSPPAEHRTVNVRMLDGENFVTEWDDFSPLPPPPDHGLRSPIVSAVLEQWTNDRGLHDCLVAWMERVMTGEFLEEVPPLTISSLDHQVRDGFSMHVLPLLLRRADIHVEVQTRAHRQTTYDMAVSVSQKSKQPNSQSLQASSQAVPSMNSEKPTSLLDQDVHDEWMQSFEPTTDAGSVAHSTITEHIVNGGTRYNTNFRSHEDTEYSHFGLPHPSSLDMDEQQQQQAGFMGALGGALGGLLSRRKYSASSPARGMDPQQDLYGPNMPAAMKASIDLTSSPVTYRSEEEDDQPYHRVVSAPPGRIGITFVEFRGHAMVSDVAPDSPLSSWVFPSDILIAIDEVPVSGMRVRDIIKVLTNRKDRQRALRVISSHAMNEFTLNQSILMPDEEHTP